MTSFAVDDVIPQKIHPLNSIISGKRIGSFWMAICIETGLARSARQLGNLGLAVYSKPHSENHLPQLTPNSKGLRGLLVKNT
jgi:hypothetical protein